MKRREHSPQKVDYKVIERDRYEQRAQYFLKDQTHPLGPEGAASQPLAIRRPYILFEDFIHRSLPQQGEVLDVCCGTGLYSLIAAREGVNLTATDIAESNLAIAQQRAARAKVALQTIIADAEEIPLESGRFDIVTCAGSLSYVNLGRFLYEVKRLLRPGGWFICVDSLNHNPVYRINRFVQYCQGKRSHGTLRRMPTLRTIGHLNEVFHHTEVSFHGALSFLGPILSRTIGEIRAAAVLDRWDDRYPAMHRWAFKFVFRGQAG